MKLAFLCSLCHIEVEIPLRQFKKEKDGGLFLHNLKCVNCHQTYESIDLKFGKD